LFFNPYAIILFVAALAILVLFFRSWGLEEVKGTREFSLLALACAIYAFFYALELSSTELNIVLIWSKLQYLGISFIAPAFLFFALKYTGRVKKFTFPWLLALLVIPIITFVLNLTNEYGTGFTSLIFHFL